MGVNGAAVLWQSHGVSGVGRKAPASSGAVECAVAVDSMCVCRNQDRTGLREETLSGSFEK